MHEIQINSIPCWQSGYPWKTDIILNLGNLDLAPVIYIGLIAYIYLLTWDEKAGSDEKCQCWKNKSCPEYNNVVKSTLAKRKQPHTEIRRQGTQRSAEQSWDSETLLLLSWRLMKLKLTHCQGTRLSGDLAVFWIWICFLTEP